MPLPGPGVSWIPSDGTSMLSSGQSRNGLESPLKLEGDKTGWQTSPCPSSTFKILYTQAPFFNSSTLWFQCPLLWEAQLQPTPIHSSKPWLKCPLPQETLSVSPGRVSTTPGTHPLAQSRGAGMSPRATEAFSLSVELFYTLCPCTHPKVWHAASAQ